MSAHIERAQHLLSMHREEEAVRELVRHLGDEPDDAQALALLALCQSDLERYREATEAARRAVAAAPELPLAHYALAYVLHDRDRSADALAAVREALRLDSGNPRYHGLESAIHADQRHWREALAAADRGLALEPDHVQCRNLRALALSGLGRGDEASEMLRGTLAEDPEEPLSHANLGWRALERGDLRAAQRSFREALRLDPNLEWARQGMLETLKARHRIYRWMLAYFLWMARQTSGRRWMIVLGAYVLFSAVRGIARAEPAALPFLAPLLVAYGLFCWLSWLADPLFNLLLFAHRDGRRVLSEDERFHAFLTGALHAAALAIAILAFGLGDLAILAPAVATLLVSLPVAAAGQLDAGSRRRRAFHVFAGVLAAAIFVGAGLVVGGAPDSDLEGIGFAVLGLGALGALLGTFAANVAQAVPRAR